MGRFVPIRNQHNLALNLSLTRLAKLPNWEAEAIANSITDQLKKPEQTQKEKAKESWKNMADMTEEEIEQILEETTQEHRAKNSKRTPKFALPGFLGFLIGSGTLWYG